MRTGKALMVAVVVVALAAVPLVAQQRGAGKSGPGRGGGMAAAMFIEQSWAALCLEMDLSQVQYGKLKPSYQWAWKQRKAAMDKAMKDRNFEAAGKTMASVKTQLEAKVKAVLTPAQLAQWNKWQTQQANRFRGPAGGGRGGATKK